MQIEQAIPYLVKLADWAAGQGFCQIEGIQDPDEWIMEAWDALGQGGDYTPEALAAALSARPDDSAVEGIVDAVIDAANIVSHDGYYEIDRDAATRSAIAALGGSGDL